MKIKQILLLTIVLAIALTSNGQTKDKKWGLGFNFGSEQYKGELGNGFYDFDQAFNGFGGITVSRYLTPHLDLSLQSTFGELTHRDNNGADYNFEYNMFQISLNLKYSLFKYETAKVRPFVFAGIGHMNFTDKKTDYVIFNTQLPDFGFGLSFRLSPNVSLVLQETFMYSDYDLIDHTTKVRKNHNDWFAQHSIGITFNLGKKDSDHDGIPNRKDKCPEIAGLELYDGCPDTDGDGIPDKDDKCPNKKGLAEFNGCPDTDGDGIADKDDACPNKKGLAEFNGCPDTDGDGVADKDDACPNKKGLAEFNGCPDTDGDGIPDKDDECPDKKGLAEFNGCPDTDGDGIADKYDKCPKVAGIAKNKGCPEIKASEIETLEKAVKGVKFKSGKAIITNSSRAILNNVASILKANKTYKLRIEGYCDSQGNDDLNLRISKQRAKAVKDYFENSGINAGRLSSTGFGEANPIADNSTAAGRAINRRVELIIEF